MAVLRPIIQMATDLLAVFVSDLFHCGAIGPKSVGNDGFWSPVSFHRFFQKDKRRLLVPGLGDVALQDFSFMIDGSPQVVLDAIDLHEDLIEVPLPLSVLPHV